MKPTPLRPGHVVQLDPETVANPAFGGCFMTIVEPTPWGATGYVQGIGRHDQPGGQYEYQAEWVEMEFVGVAQWTAQ